MKTLPFDLASPIEASTEAKLFGYAGKSKDCIGIYRREVSNDRTP